MRTIVAVTLAACLLFLGFQAIGGQALDSKPGAGASEAENSSYETAENVTTGLGDAAAVAVPWFGVASIVLVSAGLLVGVSRGGR